MGDNQQRSPHAVPKLGRIRIWCTHSQRHRARREAATRGIPTANPVLLWRRSVSDSTCQSRWNSTVRGLIVICSRAILAPVLAHNIEQGSSVFDADDLGVCAKVTI